MKLLACTFLLVSFVSFVRATLAPTYPEPGTVWRSGQEYKIIWTDNKNDVDWKKFKIDFMTGDNQKQKYLKNVAVNLDPSKTNSVQWVAPQVEPHAAIYFFMFTNEKGDHAWTTRFTITDGGNLTVPEHDTQPDGSKIPWGVGKLLSSRNTTTTPSAVYSMTPAQSSVAAENAAFVIAVSSANNIYPELLKLMVLFSVVLFTH